MGKKYKIGCISFIVLIVIALFVFYWTMFGDHSSFESGLAKYEYLPGTAHDITVYTNSNISGMFICDFSMKEKDFKDFAQKQGWEIEEIKSIAQKQGLKPEEFALLNAMYTAREFYRYRGDANKRHQIKNGLYYSKRADNGGGITVVYDRDNNRGYINKKLKVSFYINNISEFKMWTYKQALKVMECWVEQITNGEGLIDEEATIAKPYGWIFFYRPKSYFQSKDFKDVFIGAGPVVFDRLEGEISVFGSGQSIEKSIKQYEKAIPKIRLKMSPEKTR